MAESLSEKLNSYQEGGCKMDVGLIGAIGGSTIGLLGAAFGTYCGIKSTKTPAECRFAVRCAIAIWIAGSLLIGLPLLLSLIDIIPVWSYWMAFALFFILLGPAIFWMNKRQATLRGEKA